MNFLSFNAARLKNVKAISASQPNIDHSTAARGHDNVSVGWSRNRCCSTLLCNRCCSTLLCNSYPSGWAYDHAKLGEDCVVTLQGVVGLVRIEDMSLSEYRPVALNAMGCPCGAEHMRLSIGRDCNLLSVVGIINDQEQPERDGLGLLGMA